VENLRCLANDALERLSLNPKLRVFAIARQPNRIQDAFMNPSANTCGIDPQVLGNFHNG
jgi:hypothetical protein